MKLSAHNARVDAAGLHNDRNFDLEYAPHIDKEKITENRYWTHTGVKNQPLNEIELAFYKEHFAKYLKEQNRRNIQTGHKERNRTIKQYYKGQHTRPEDKILQIGDKDSHPDPEKLWECTLEYQRRFEEIFGEHCKILDMSLHLDEATPHVHIRRVWIYKDENGIERVGETKALEQMGILENDTSKKKGRYNNSKITFTMQDRQLFRDICAEKGLELEDDAPALRKHLSVPEYKAVMEDVRDLERQRSALRQELDEAAEEQSEIVQLCDSIEGFLTSPMYYNTYDQEVAEAKGKSLAKRAALLMAIMKEEADKIAESQGSFRAVMEEASAESQNRKLQKEINSLNHKVEILNQFIIQRGLGQEAIAFIQDPERENMTPHRNLLN